MVVSSTAAPWYHAAVTRTGLCILAAAMLAAACGSAVEKQWYKPTGEYTVADFKRDRAACEKDGKLDESCLRERGWLPLTLDKEKPPPPPPTSPRGGSGIGRY
jgi:hypothetical protein